MVSKRFILSFVFSIFCFGSFNTGLSNQVKKYTPTNTAIVTDLHGVLVKFDYPGLAKHVCCFGLGGGLLYKLSPTVFFSACAFFAAEALDVFARIISSKHKHGGFCMERVFDADPLVRCFKPEWVRLSSLFKPNENMFALLEELKTAGYKIILASNVNPESLEMLRDRYPQLRLSKKGGLFSDALTPTQKNRWLNKKLRNKNNDSTTAGEPFYEMLVKKVEEPNIIYIDDKQKNCDKAYAFRSKKNVVPHLFTSVEKCREFLAQHHVDCAVV